MLPGPPALGVHTKPCGKEWAPLVRSPTPAVSERLAPAVCLLVLHTSLVGIWSDRCRILMAVLDLARGALSLLSMVTNLRALTRPLATLERRLLGRVRLVGRFVVGDASLVALEG